MFAIIGEPTYQVTPRPTSSEDEIYGRDTIDYEQGVVEEEEEEEEETDYETDKQIVASGLSKGPWPWSPKVNPNNLIEKLELLIRETKTGQDALYDEMLNISKQLLPMNIINQEQLDFLIMVNK